MKYYKDKSDAVYAFAADGSQDDFIPAELAPIPEAEADALRFPKPTPDQAKATAWESIKAERDRRVENGGYNVGEKWFHSDQHSRSQQIGMVLLGASLPANLQWKTMDCSFVTMTATLAKQILEAAAASDQAIFAKAEAHKTAMLASADPASYDHLSGWPAVFGE